MWSETRFLALKREAAMRDQQHNVVDCRRRLAPCACLLTSIGCALVGRVGRTGQFHSRHGQPSQASGPRRLPVELGLRLRLVGQGRMVEHNA